jgi:hypothetical protein
VPQIDFDTPIRDRAGAPLKSGDAPITLAVCCISALEANHRDEADLAGAEKVRRKRLADRIYAGGAQNVSVEDLSLLKAVTGRALTIYVAGVVWDLLDPPGA